MTMSEQQFFNVEPEVAGGLAEGTVIDRSSHPPVVSKVHYRVEGWLGDGLIESFPVFLLRKEAWNAIASEGLTGARIDNAEISVAPDLSEVALPVFVWFRPTGIEGTDDFGTAPDGRLVMSQRARNVLAEFGLAHAEITPV
ncbi:hypothetical protein RM543_10595 [Roseicyclus sp. F158]|uniref:Uncharacterized protein n=1 Tax=Tropicimonas omnivorans TaxID=3075590 RepID=A0ABU3DHD4_9RHOB|nr:hypothetical protein [Roseicyclus sp. F158]MDT0683135.1 hypothetical protein [Roseicyclus sp. F158]